MDTAELQTKEIDFFGKKTRILVENSIPLHIICNILVLRGKAVLKSEVRQDQLIYMVQENIVDAGDISQDLLLAVIQEVPKLTSSSCRQSVDEICKLLGIQLFLNETTNQSGKGKTKDGEIGIQFKNNEYSTVVQLDGDFLDLGSSALPAFNMEISELESSSNHLSSVLKQDGPEKEKNSAELGSLCTESPSLVQQDAPLKKKLGIVSWEKAKRGRWEESHPLGLAIGGTSKINLQPKTRELLCAMTQEDDPSLDLTLGIPLMTFYVRSSRLNGVIEMDCRATLTGLRQEIQQLTNVSGGYSLCFLAGSKLISLASDEDMERCKNHWWRNKKQPITVMVLGLPQNRNADPRK